MRLTHPHWKTEGDRDHGSGGSGYGDDGEKEDSGEADAEVVSPMTQLFFEHHSMLATSSDAGIAEEQSGR